MKHYRHSLEEIYTTTDRLVLEYQAGRGRHTEHEEHCILAQILEVTDELIRYNCDKFIAVNGVYTVSYDEIYAEAVGMAFYKAINNYKPVTADGKENHFVSYWNLVCQSYFKNAIRDSNSKKRQAFNTAVSTEVEICEGDYSLLDALSTGNDMGEVVVEKLHLRNVLQEWNKITKYPNLIECELIGTKEIRTKAILHILGATEYGAKERKIVQRHKEKFAEFLVQNGYSEYKR